MPYDWRIFQDLPWAKRFPMNVRGSISWQQQAVEAPTNFRALAAKVMDARERIPRITRPCVFVSHRRIDVNPALRIAYLACQQGFDYWLDVLDPKLTDVPTASAEQEAAATAAVIEMALLNSSHVIAVMTPNTP